MVPWPWRQFKWLGGPACAHVSLVCLHFLSPDLQLTELSFLFPSVSPLSTQQCFLPQSPLMFKDQMQQDVIMVLKFPSNSPVTHVAANTLPHLTIPAVVTVTCSRLFAVNRWHNTVGTWASALTTELRGGRFQELTCHYTQTAAGQLLPGPGSSTVCRSHSPTKCLRPDSIHSLHLSKLPSIVSLSGFCRQ